MALLLAVRPWGRVMASTQTMLRSLSRTGASKTNVGSFLPRNGGRRGSAGARTAGSRGRVGMLCVLLQVSARMRGLNN